MQCNKLRNKREGFMRKPGPVKPHNRDGIWYLVRRVPKEFAELDRRRIVRISTDIPVVSDPRCDPSGELRDQAGTYVNLITSSPIKSLATRRSGGRGPAKNGLPPPSTTGWR